MLLFQQKEALSNIIGLFLFSFSRIVKMAMSLISRNASSSSMGIRGDCWIQTNDHTQVVVRVSATHGFLSHVQVESLIWH